MPEHKFYAIRDVQLVNGTIIEQGAEIGGVTISIDMDVHQFVRSAAAGAFTTEKVQPKPPPKPADAATD